MYKYTICNQPDEEIFYQQCTALEKNIPKLKLASELSDVDGSLIRIYHMNGAQIKIKNDFYIGGVFVDSELELTQFFK